ncbi:MAG: hypothetical protein CUN55_12255 [Phototrophicales bacterium]|nr:MAG: hypothetical protein CUN55_12255 [Phototrophicales bacterium]
MFYNIEETGRFMQMILTIVGQALNAAGYNLEQDQLQQQRGLVRFQKPLENLGEDVYGFVEWQLLAFRQSPVSRFQITLLRNQGRIARAKTLYEHQDEKTLSWVMWHVFDAKLLPNDDAWWEFQDVSQQTHAIATAGRALFGYGIPWLEMHSIELP